MKNVKRNSIWFLSIFVFCEIVIRIAHPYIFNKLPDKGTSIWNPDQLFHTYPNTAIVYRLLPNLDIKFRGKQFSTNSDGLRGKEVAPKGKKFRILGLGDSVQMGWGVKDNETYLNVLENHLNSKGFNVDTVNTAVAGYNTTQEFFTFKKIGLKYNPDLVILHYIGNDLESMRHQVGIFAWNSHSKFINMIQFLFLKISGKENKKNYYDISKIKIENKHKEDFFESLDRIHKLCLDKQIPLVLVLGSRYIGTWLKHSEIETLAKEKKIKTINLFTIMREIDENTSIADAVTIKDEHNRKYLIEFGEAGDNHPNYLWHKDVALILSNEVSSYITK